MWHGGLVRGVVVAAIAVAVLAVMDVNQLRAAENRAAAAGVVAAPAAAPRPCGDIRYEEGVTGVIGSDGDGCRHVFTGAAGDIVSIWLAPDESLAPVVQLVDPTGDVIAEAVSVAAGQAAAIRSVRLSQAGVYSIVTAGYGGSADGTYTLSLWRTNACGGSLGDFDPRYGELTAGQTECAYTFRGSRDGFFTFGVSAPDGNRFPILRVQDANGRAIQDPSTNGRISGMLPADGVYAVVVRTRGNSQRNGRFVLSSPDLVIIQLAPGCGQTVDYGDVVNAAIGSGDQFDTCYYRFWAEVGDVVTIVMIRRSASLDPLLELENPAEDRIARDNDGAGNRNAAIRARVLASEGLHTIVATSYQGQTTGPFELRLGLGQFVLADEVRNVHPQQDTVNVRRSAGWRNKPASDVVGEIQWDDTAEIVGGPDFRDSLTWWMIAYTTPAGNQITGWSADTSGSGAPLLALAR